MFLYLCNALTELVGAGTLLIFVLLSFLIYTVQRATIAYKRHRLLPPGPRGLPILGCLPFISGDFHEYLTDLSEKHGKIFSIKLGKELFVVLSDHKLIREAFRREEYCARPDNAFSKILDGLGIINAEGKLWKEQRRFLHDRLRAFGVKHAGNGREHMEARIMTEVEDLMKELGKKKSQPVDLSTNLSCTVANVISSMLMSVRFSHDDGSFKRFMHLCDEGFRLFTIMAAAAFLPFLRFLPGMSKAYTQICKNRDEIGQFFQKIISDHRESFSSDNIRDIIDAYLLSISEAQEENRFNTLFDGRDPDKQMEQIIGDMFSAGSESVKTTLLWSMVYSIREPEMQKKVQDELDRVVGRSRMPSLDDIQHLPYTEAFLCECMRRSTAVPLGTIHSTTRDNYLGGYLIPKGAQIVPLIHAVHMNAETWNDPEGFIPERFIKDEIVQRPDCFIPFGVGRRMCLGDTLAKAELFLIFSSLLHVFTIASGDDTVPSLKGHSGVTLTPNKFLLRAIPRQIETIPRKHASQG